MQTILRFTLGAITLTALALSAGSAGRAFSRPDGADQPVAVGPAPDGVPEARRSADSIASIIASGDPFRSTRSPATVRYDPRVADGVAAAPPAAPQRPPLVLVGILNGHHASALLDGVPGSEVTRVVRAGDRIGDFSVRHIAGDSVVVSGRDTTWTIRVRRMPQ